MEDPSDRERQERSWYIPLWIDTRDVRLYRSLRRACATLGNQLEARRFWRTKCIASRRICWTTCSGCVWRI